MCVIVGGNCWGDMNWNGLVHIQIFWHQNSAAVYHSAAAFYITAIFVGKKWNMRINKTPIFEKKQTPLFSKANSNFFFKTKPHFSAKRQTKNKIEKWKMWVFFHPVQTEVQPYPHWLWCAQLPTVFTFILTSLETEYCPSTYSSGQRGTRGCTRTVSTLPSSVRRVLSSVRCK